jgi:NAD-dependent DNA ligase
MKKSDIDRLKQACFQFYLDVDIDKLPMSDAEFDTLAKQYELEEGKSVKSLVPWDEVTKLPNNRLATLDKEVVTDNTLREAAEEFTKDLKLNQFHINLKYDGSSIRAYYVDGKLQKILSTPDKEMGIVRTKAFWNIFPHEVDKSIESIQGEVLVDRNTYGLLARNKANGLTNSKNMDDEVESNVFVRVYNVLFNDTDEYDYYRLLKTLRALPSIHRERTRLADSNTGEVKTFNDTVFSSAYELSFDEIPSDPSIDLKNGDHFMADGIVIYTDKCVKGFKFYFNDSASVKIKDIDWRLNYNGSYSPVLQFDTVILEGKSVSQASANGVPNLINMKMGIGAQVTLILANLTIPKIIKVTVPSEDYNYPKCRCGYQLSDKDIYGAVLKCGNNGRCIQRYMMWILEIHELPSMSIDFISEHRVLPEDKDKIVMSVLEILHIDRVDAVKRFYTGLLKLENKDRESVMSDLYNSIVNDSPNEFSKIADSVMHLSTLSSSIMYINCSTAIMCVKDYFNI